MKKLCLLLALCMLFSAAAGAVRAESGNVYLINRALDLLDSRNYDRVEVRNIFDAYQYNNPGSFSVDGVKCIILERYAPDKEFFISDDDLFEIGATGGDIGEARVFVRLDLMRRLPRKMQAKSLGEANILVFAETMHALESEIVHTEYEGGSGSIPDYLTNAAELAQYLAEHPRRVIGHTYKPLYNLYMMITAYSTTNKTCMISTYQKNPYLLKPNNPRAAAQWDAMKNLGEALKALDATGEGVRSSAAKKALDAAEDVAQRQRNTWKDLISNGDYDTARYSIEKVYWPMAEELAAMDDSEIAAEWYPVIIESRDLAALEFFVSYQDYTGVSLPDETIIDEKLYMGAVDEDWMDGNLDDFVMELVDLAD